MKALGFQQHGELEVMKLLDLPVPFPGRGEVLVSVKASSFNHLDIWVRKGWPGLKLSMPHICGSDAAGVIAALGEGVSGFSVGERVSIYPGINRIEDDFTLAGDNHLSPGYTILGEHPAGTHAEFITVPSKNVLKLPDQVSFEVAAASGLVCLTAWRMLIHRAKIKVGENVLVIGAGGGVNSVAIQLAKLAGCTVYATTGGEEKVAKAKALGADVVIDYKAQANWSKQLYTLTNNKGFDVIVDNVGAATLNESIRLAKQGGRIVIVGNTSGPIVQLDLRYVFSKQISILGSTMGNYLDYRHVMELVFSGKIKPVIHTIMPLEQGVEAMGILEKGEQFGKVVLCR